MAAINVLCDEVADHGTNDHVRRKMLLGAHARNVDQRSQTVSHDFSKRARIFVCDDSGNGPCCGGVLRRKRSAATLEERPASVALIRSLAPQRVLEGLDRHQAVQRGFSREKAGLTPMLIVANVTQRPHSSRPTNKGSYTSV